MNTKFCPYCGQELPEESVFCPYCMTKLIDVQTGKPIKKNKKKYIIPITIIIVILFIVGAIVFFVAKDSTQENQVSITTVNTTISDNTTELLKNDYSKYIGLWSDKGNNVENLKEKGGNLLEIISVKGDIVRFTFTKTSANGRIARICNVITKIIDNTGTFTFDDDCWQNSGTGKIKLNNDEIYIETNITYKNKEAMWDIGGSFYLTKTETSILDFESYNYIGEDFDTIKNKFGEERSCYYDDEAEADVHIYSGLSVYNNTETNEIIKITVSYSGTLSNSQICYGNINGNSSYDDVYSNLGEPLYNNLSQGYVEYIVDGNTLHFDFDENADLTSFSLKAE